MILVKFMERITEYEFDHFYVFKDYTKDAYDKEKITEEKLLRDFFSGVADKPQFNPFSKEKDWWRFGETIIWVADVQTINQKQYETLKELGITY